MNLKEEDIHISKHKTRLCIAELNKSRQRISLLLKHKSDLQASLSACQLNANVFDKLSNISIPSSRNTTPIESSSSSHEIDQLEKAIKKQDGQADTLENQNKKLIGEIKVLKTERMKELFEPSQQHLDAITDLQTTTSALTNPFQTIRDEVDKTELSSVDLDEIEFQAKQLCQSDIDDLYSNENYETDFNILNHDADDTNNDFGSNDHDDTHSDNNGIDQDDQDDNNEEDSEEENENSNDDDEDSIQNENKMKYSFGFHNYDDYDYDYGVDGDNDGDNDDDDQEADNYQRKDDDYEEEKQNKTPEVFEISDD